MIPIEEFEHLLNEAAGRIPQALYARLNGGILLLPEVKTHKEAVHNDLYVLGEYHQERHMGRYIVIYYGSFMAALKNLNESALADRIESVLKHEFLHHLEAMAGENELAEEDARAIETYRRKVCPKDE